MTACSPHRAGAPQRMPPLPVIPAIFRADGKAEPQNAPMPRTQGAPAAMKPHAPLPCKRPAGAPPIPGTPAAANKRPKTSPPQEQTSDPPTTYLGVRRDAAGQWIAVVSDPKRGGAPRAVGPFPDAHAAALAHDRAAFARDGERAHVNFWPAFHPIELEFLRRCSMIPRMDLCGLLANGGYEDGYAKFLRSVYAKTVLGRLGVNPFFDGVILDFFVARATEIGGEALEAGGERLVARFVQMHRNKAPQASWRAWHRRRIELLQQPRQHKMMVVQQQHKTVDVAAILQNIRAALLTD